MCWCILYSGPRTRELQSRGFVRQPGVHMTGAMLVSPGATSSPWPAVDKMQGRAAQGGERSTHAGLKRLTISSLMEAASLKYSSKRGLQPGHRRRIRLRRGIQCTLLGCFRCCTRPSPTPPLHATHAPAAPNGVKNRAGERWTHANARSGAEERTIAFLSPPLDTDLDSPASAHHQTVSAGPTRTSTRSRSRSCESLRVPAQMKAHVARRGKQARSRGKFRSANALGAGARAETQPVRNPAAGRPAS